jgi:hypothetical protein
MDDYIDQTAAELAEKLRDRPDASQLLRRLFDGLCAKLLEGRSTDHVSASNVVVEVADDTSGLLYRRYLELGYEENDNGIGLKGESMAGETARIVFLSDRALKKMNDLRGAGPDTPRCKGE